MKLVASVSKGSIFSGRILPIFSIILTTPHVTQDCTSSNGISGITSPRAAIAWRNASSTDGDTTDFSIIMKKGEK